jgi:hypothetical protein
MRSVIESAHQYGTDSRSDAGQFALQIVVQPIVSIENAISYVSSSNLHTNRTIHNLSLQLLLAAQRTLS